MGKMNSKGDIYYVYGEGDMDAMKQMDICADLCHEYNLLKPSDSEGKAQILKQIFGCEYEGANIHAPFYCDFGTNITLGKNFFANYNTVLLDGAAITFGDNVMLGPNCGFYTNLHPLLPEQRHVFEYARPIVVGSDVWFGAGVHVLPGVTIGSGCVIGAGSVVTKDIPDGVIAVGNPCRVVRPITENDRMDLKKALNEAEIAM